MRDPVWWLWLVAVIMFYVVCALAGCDLAGGSR